MKINLVDIVLFEEKLSKLKDYLHQCSYEDSCCICGERHSKTWKDELGDPKKTIKYAIESCICLCNRHGNASLKSLWSSLCREFDLEKELEKETSGPSGIEEFPITNEILKVIKNS